jgi:hypothetical protein
VARRPLEREEVSPDGGRRTTQLMRDPLGATHSTVRHRAPVVLAIAALGLVLGLLAGPAIVLRYRTHTMMPVVTRFLASAQALDSAGVAKVADSAVWSLIRERPLLHGYFQNASYGVRPASLAWRGDSALLGASLRRPFPTQECGLIEALKLVLVRRDLRWRIVKFSTGMC